MNIPTEGGLEKKSIVLDEGDFRKATIIAKSRKYGRTSASNILRMFLDSEALNKTYEEVIAQFPQLLTGANNG